MGERTHTPAPGHGKQAHRSPHSSPGTQVRPANAWLSCRCDTRAEARALIAILNVIKRMRLEVRFQRMCSLFPPFTSLPFEKN